MRAYRVGSVAGAREVDHAVEAGVGCAIALVPVRIQLLLGEHITAVLAGRNQLQGASKRHGAEGHGAECAVEGRGINK